MVEALSPASLPKNSVRAGSKSLVEMPRRYSTGRTSVTLGERRAQGGRMALVKRRPARRSWTRGVWISSNAGRRRHFPRLADPVTDDQCASLLVTVVGVLGDVPIYLGFQRSQQHAAGSLAHQSVEVELQRVLFGLIRGDYAQHAAYLSLTAPRPCLVLNNQEGTPRSSSEPRSTTSGYSSPAHRSRRMSEWSSANVAGSPSSNSPATHRTSIR